MLMFSRRIGERIVVGGRVEVKVTEIHRSSVRLAISAPRDQSIARGEVFDAVAEANRRAAEAVVDEELLLAGEDGEPSVSVTLVELSRVPGKAGPP